MHEKVLVHELKHIFPQLNSKILARYVQQQFYPEHFALKDEQLMSLNDCNIQELVLCFKDLLVTLELDHLGMYEFINVKAGFDWATGRIVPIPEVDIGYFFRLVKPKKLKTKILATLNQQVSDSFSFDTLRSQIRELRREYIDLKYGGANSFTKDEWRRIYILHFGWYTLNLPVNRGLRKLIGQEALELMNEAMQFHVRQVQKQRVGKYSAISDSEGRVFARKIRAYPNNSDQFGATYFEDLLRDTELYMPPYEVEEYYDDEVEYLEDEYELPTF